MSIMAGPTSAEKAENIIKNNSQETLQMTKTKTNCAQTQCDYGRKIVVKKGKMFPKGSGGINDATSDWSKFEDLYLNDPKLNPNLATGKGNQIGFVVVTINDAVNGATSLKSIVTDPLIDLSEEFLNNVAFGSSKGVYVFPYKLKDGTNPSKKSIAPGVDFFGDYDSHPLPPSSYKEGRNEVNWEWINPSDGDPLANLPLIPEWLATLLEQETPFDEVAAGSMHLEKIQNKFLEGFQGPDNQRLFHDAVCHLRAFGEKKRDIDGYVSTALLKSSPTIDKTWANSCVKHICFTYEPVYIPQKIDVQTGTQTLADAFS